MIKRCILILFSFSWISGAAFYKQHEHIVDLIAYAQQFKDQKDIYIFLDIDDTVLSTFHQSRTTVENDTSEIIKQLKIMGCHVHALTARSISQAHQTAQLLARVNVHFDQFEAMPIALEGSQDVGYHGGVFYAGSTPKGDILKQLFCNRQDDDSMVIIFVDDLFHDSVMRVAQDLNIQTFYMHYMYAQRNIYNHA